ncbi:asparagine synthase-related protein [Roseomonas sp. CECT 9278]|uniref:asparagine synthase-related protein n=1 Tax=Roseomonas sp. CECT 9278 TaxID=2845823 RepID=UPI001E6367F4|nr:asparagine synthase-related protein [Roseomonas sp. CECT 9278]CAH0127737.1 Asparagine synthetase B [glutamine-hydrolyzing] [Roseomonas sp. CECT 9278]
MCGFIVDFDDAPVLAERVRRRGPDHHGEVVRGGFRFSHFLLHITGSLLPQPLVDGDIVCVFNGEIYNHPHTVSDGEVIIPLYRKFGSAFARELDGEFAIALYDFAKREAVFITDPFSSKPLWIDGLRCSSYVGALGQGIQLPPNTLLVRSFDCGEKSFIVRPFDFRNQHKTNLDDWTRALKRSIEKRAVHDCFIGLSAGYDSGVIAVIMQELGIKFSSYSLAGSENMEVLRERVEQFNAAWVDEEDADVAWARSFLKEYVEEYCYGSVAGVTLPYELMTDDVGAIASCLLYRHAHSEGKRIVLSGQGADEIYADYPFWPAVGGLRGIFPEKLEPWVNFSGGCQRAFLAKEEHIAGAFGIEARYPFLDWALVQEFLWLSQNLKNSAYKAPLASILSSHHIAWAAGQKTGFGPRKR